MRRRLPTATRTYTLFPYTTLFRARAQSRLMRLHWTPHAGEDLFRLAEALGDPDSEAALLRGTIIATEQLQAHPRIGPAIDGTRIRKWPIAETPCLFLDLTRTRLNSSH